MTIVLPRDPGSTQEVTSTNLVIQKKKKWHSKVRTGCDRCKVRRVKCDETHPECKRCSRAGYACPGYVNVPQANIFEPEIGPRFGSEMEKRSYDYLLRDGIQVLTTFQPSCRVFYTQSSAQISQTFEPLKYIMIAVGAIQAPVHYAKPGQAVRIRMPQLPPLPLMAITKAMHLLASADPKELPVEGFAACCLFFMAIDIWTGKVGAAPVHTLAGLRLVEEHIRSARKGLVPLSALAETEILPMFQRLTINACTFTDDYPSPASGLPQNYMLDMDLDIVGAFGQMEYAFEEMVTILKCVLRVREGVTTKTIREKLSLALNQFDQALTVFYLEGVKDISTYSRTGNMHDHDYRHLRMTHRVASVMFHTANCIDEAAYDQFKADFLFILSECKTALYEDSQVTRKATSSLRTSIGMISPLFFVATKCRDPAIRRQAVALLHSTARSERGWTSCMATSLARWVIVQEEQKTPGISHPPPRIRLEDVNFSSEDRRTYLEYWECFPRCAPVFTASSIPYIPHPSVQVDGNTFKMAKKVLHGFGYTGILLFSPKITCHCVTGEVLSHRITLGGNVHKDQSQIQPKLDSSKLNG